MQQNCPSCGAPLKIIPGAIEIVCPYCNTILLIQRWIIENTWEKSILIPFPTTFKIWEYFFAIEDNTSNDEIFWKKVKRLTEKEIRENNITNYITKIYVYWHISVQNNAWIWDKWFVNIIDWQSKGKIMLEEDEWLITAYERKHIKQNDDFFNQLYEKFYNQNIMSDNWFFLNEVWQAQINWFEWQYEFIIWKKYLKYIKWTLQNKITLLENYWGFTLYFNKI